MLNQKRYNVLYTWLFFIYSHFHHHNPIENCWHFLHYIMLQERLVSAVSIVTNSTNLSQLAGIWYQNVLLLLLRFTFRRVLYVHYEMHSRIFAFADFNEKYEVKESICSILITWNLELWGSHLAYHWCHIFFLSLKERQKLLNVSTYLCVGLLGFMWLIFACTYYYYSCLKWERYYSPFLWHYLLLFQLLDRIFCVKLNDYAA
jgi:hypothetical protein